MERNTAIILLSFIGLFTVFSLADGCKCNIEHPQERFCKAAFAFVGKITDVVTLQVDGLSFMRYTFTYSPHQVYKGRNLLSRDRFNQTVYTPYYGNLCGRPNLHRGVKYFMSGTVEEGNLMISYCDWIDDWEDVTQTQRHYLRDSIYASNCANCQIPGTIRFEMYDQNLHSDYSNNLQMSGYWTMRKCHYNPIASAYFQSVDCEADISYCTYNEEAGMCLWKWSVSYGKCFTERETLWQILSGARPAFTGLRQCRGISTPKLKKKCKRTVLAQKKLRKLERRHQREQAEEEVQLPFDLDL